MLHEVMLPFILEGHGDDCSGGNCLIKRQSSVNWFEARRRCREKNADLLSIESNTWEITNKDLETLLTDDTNAYWIGATNQIWKWESGTYL